MRLLGHEVAVAPHARVHLERRRLRQRVEGEAARGELVLGPIRGGTAVARRSRRFRQVGAALGVQKLHSRAPAYGTSLSKTSVPPARAARESVPAPAGRSRGWPRRRGRRKPRSSGSGAADRARASTARRASGTAPRAQPRSRQSASMSSETSTPSTSRPAFSHGMSKPAGTAGNVQRGLAALDEALEVLDLGALRC